MTNTDQSEGFNYGDESRWLRREKKWSLFRKILGKRKRFENVQRNKK